MVRSADAKWARSFVDDLADVRLADVFNPYRDVCKAWDLPEGSAVRRRNLEVLLSAAAAEPVDAIWFGQELGYQGGRRTGLPFSDEYRLTVWGTRFGIGLTRATHGRPSREPTAGAIAEALERLPHLRVVAWNAFPFHAHKLGRPLTNRAHSALEARVGAPFAERLLAQLAPKRVVAVGVKAAESLRRMGWDPVCVRHPSYGGLNEFRAGVALGHRGL